MTSLRWIRQRYVKESDEETSRTVEMYDMVSLVSTRSGKLSMQMGVDNGKDVEIVMIKTNGDLTQKNDEDRAEEKVIEANTEEDEELSPCAGRTGRRTE